MKKLLSQKWCLCLNVQNRIKLCRAKNHKFGDDMTVGAHIFKKGEIYQKPKNWLCG